MSRPCVGEVVSHARIIHEIAEQPESNNPHPVRFAENVVPSSHDKIFVRSNLVRIESKEVEGKSSAPGIEE